MLLQDDADPLLDDVQDDLEATDDSDRVLLEGDEHAAARVAARRRAKAKADADAKARAEALEAARPQVLLEGRVVVDATNQPLQGATIHAETAQANCPRIPARVTGGVFVLELGTDPGGGAMLGPSMRSGVQSHALRQLLSTSWTTGKDGRFTITVAGGADLTALQGAFDLFVTSRGYIGQALCAVPNGKDVLVRMRKGAELSGHVRNIHDRPIEGARIMAMPATGTPEVLGFVAAAHTDATGRFELEGLDQGVVTLAVSHPNYIPQKVERVDTRQQRVPPIRLVASYRVSFALETGDAEAPRTPSVEWITSGTTPRHGLTVVALQDGANRSPWPTVPVAIPCDRQEVRFTVKATGYAPWKSEAVLVPPEGGEATIAVPLQPDTTLGRLTVRFETESGDAVSYADLGAHNDIHIRGTQEVEGGLVMQTSTDFKLTAVPPGPYALLFSMRDYAPVRVEVEARAGEETVETVTLRPPARLRVRFSAPEPALVGFHIKKDNRVVLAFPMTEQDAPLPERDQVEAPKAKADENGTVFSGLGSGDHVIEITDAKFHAPRTRVTLVEGDEVEVAIRLERR